MKLIDPPSINVAYNPKDPSIQRPRSGPVRLPPIPEVSDASAANTRTSVKSASTAIEQPISLPDASGRLSAKAPAGQKINLQA